MNSMFVINVFLTTCHYQGTYNHMFISSLMLLCQQLLDKEWLGMNYDAAILHHFLTGLNKLEMKWTVNSLKVNNL